MKRALILACLLLVAGGVARADATADSAADLAAAQHAYAAKQYDAAIAKYEAVVARGVHNEQLYYDLGNAYYLAAKQTDAQARAGKLGRAILAYERALRIDPGFEDAKYNLEVARELAAARFGKDDVVGAGRDPFWMRAVHWLPLATLTWVFLALDALFFLVLIVVRFLPTGFTRTGLIVSDVFIGLAGAFLGLLLFGQIYYRNNVRMSVVVSDEAVMREAPDPTRREMPTLHAGLRVVIVKEADGWVLVRLANRTEGWVVKDAVEEI